MRPNADKNRKLIKQYPFLATILERDFAPVAPLENKTQIDNLSIGVRVADANLMYAQAQNVGLQNNTSGQSWITNVKPDGTERYGSQAEYLLAIDENGSIINELSWPETRMSSLSKSGYARDVFWTNNRSFEVYLYAVTYLVWVTVQTWYRAIPDDDWVADTFVERSVSITIHKAPKQGFQALEEDANVFDNLFLSSEVLSTGGRQADHHIIMISGMLAELAEFFNSEVYNNGMRDVALGGGNWASGSGYVGSVRVLIGESCGYERIMLNNATCWLSLQTRNAGQSLYVLGMGGRLPELRNLVKTVITHWNYKADGRAHFSHDSEVYVL